MISFTGLPGPSLRAKTVAPWSTRPWSLLDIRRNEETRFQMSQADILKRFREAFDKCDAAQPSPGTPLLQPPAAKVLETNYALDLDAPASDKALGRRPAHKSLLLGAAIVALAYALFRLRQRVFQVMQRAFFAAGAPMSDSEEETPPARKARRARKQVRFEDDQAEEPEAPRARRAAGAAEERIAKEAPQADEKDPNLLIL